MQHIDLLEKGVNYVWYQDVLQQLEIGTKLSQVYYVQKRDYRSRIKLPTQYNVKCNLGLFQSTKSLMRCQLETHPILAPTE